MAGAPVLLGTPGALIGVLDAVLVDGFGLQTASGVVISGGVAVVSVPTTHAAAVDAVVLIAGASVAGLNGEQRVTAITANSVSFSTTETGAVTGTVTIKMAPAGWSKLYGGTNLAAYKIIDVTGTGCILRVDDTGTTAARVRGYESMTDVSTGAGLFPTVAQWAAPGLWWSKSNGADATARAWRVAADSRGVYFFPKNYAGQEHQGNYFGDILSLKSNDPYGCVLRANSADQAGNAAVFGQELSYNDPAFSQDGLYLARAANAIGGAVKCHNAHTLSIGAANGAYAIGGTGAPYPSQVDNGLMLSRIAIYNAAGFRGYYPGVYATPQNVVSSFSTGDKVLGSGDMVGKNVVAVKFNSITPGAQQACLFVDPISDWR